ncbi:MAG TPA: hypothetical protein VF096_07180 [Azonexus sp.]
MKRLLFRLLRYRAARRARGRPAASVHEEMHRGALIGLVVCLLFAAASGGRPGPVLWAALIGAGVGALSGLLLWLGSDQLDEQPIVPPQRSRWRPDDAVPRRAPAGRALRHADSGRHPTTSRARR